MRLDILRRWEGQIRMIWPEKQLRHKINDVMEKVGFLQHKKRQGNIVGKIIAQFQQNLQYFKEASNMVYPPIQAVAVK